jgi:hypothetical protein
VGNSLIKLEQVKMECEADGDVAPILAVGGSEYLPLISAAYQTQVAILDGGPIVQTMGWKWNRGYFIPFFTNSFQQDYAANNLTISWLERCKGYDYNNTSVPKPDIDILVRRDIVDTFRQFWGPVNIAWEYNSQLMYGVWGGTALANLHGLSNPGANVVYTNPVGATGAVINPITQIKDPNGNYWVLTTYGTCGSTQPSWPATPSYPTITSPSTVATTQADGTCVWTAINPMGQGYRISPTPPQSGRVWYVQPIGQLKPVQYSGGLESYITPIPDEMYSYFLEGVKARLKMNAKDPKARQAAAGQWALWQQALDNSCRKGNLEPDDFMFLPPNQVMAPIGGGSGPRPDFPLSGGGVPGFWY